MSHDRHALAGRQPVRLDDDALTGRRSPCANAAPPRPRRANAPARAIGTPAAAATSWQNALLHSIRAAAARRPEDRDPGLDQRIGDPGGQRRLGADDDQLDGLAPRERDDRRRIERIDARHASDTRLASDRITPRRHDDLVDARLAGQLPGKRMLAPATAHDQDAGRHHEAHAGSPARLRIGRQARSIVWVRSGPTDTSTIGTPACASIADR